MGSENDNEVRWYENDGLGNFTVPNFSFISGAGSGVQSVYAADLDGDGDIDVLAGSENDNEVRWYENDGSGTFSEPFSSLISTEDNGIRSVYAADLDGDGDLDVLAGSQFGVHWYENRAFTFGASTDQSIIVEGDTGSVLDTILLLASAPAEDTTIVYYHLEGTAVRDQDFQSELTDTGQILILPGDITKVLLFSILGDLTPDSDVDIIFVTDSIIVNNSCVEIEPFSSQLVIIEDDISVEVQNTSNIEGDTLRFTVGLNIPPSFDTTSFDYRLVEQSATVAGGDLAEIFTGTLTILQGSDGTEFEIAIPTLDNTDLDGPKTFLLIFSNIENGTLLNDTAIGFILDDEGFEAQELIFCAQPIISIEGDAVQSVYAADFDGDGDIDVLAGSFNDDDVRWYENDGSGTFYFA